MEESISQFVNGTHPESSNDNINGLFVSPAKMEINVVTEVEQFDDLKNHWNRLARQSDSYIFQTFEWNRIWWEYFGAGKKLHIVVVTYDDLVIGIIPLFWDTYRLFNREIYSCLRFLGSTVSQPEGENLMGMIAYSDYLDTIVQPGYESTVYELLIRHLKDIASEYDELILEEVPAESTLCRYLLPALEENGFDYRSEICSRSPVIDLNCSWDEYLNSMSKKSRYNARRNLKMSTKESHKTFDVIDLRGPDEVVPVYDEMVRLHQQRWNNLGYPGTFAEDRMYQFLKKVSVSFYQNGWLQFKRAVPTGKDEDESVAIDMILTYGNRVCMLHRAMDDESPYVQDGPGNVLLYRILKEVADSYFKTFDFLRGVHEFKRRSADEINVNKRIEIENPAIKSRIKSKFARTVVCWRRRLKIENFQFRLFFTDSSVMDGLKRYFSFVRSRINRKMTD